MKYATRMLVLALTMLPLVATAQLSGGEKIVAQVPFEFVLGSKVVPPGEWIVQTANMYGSVLQIRNKAAAVSLMFMPSLVGDKRAAGDCTLVFHKYGSTYFLAKVRIAGSDNSYQLPESKAEAEILAKNVPVTNEILVASRK